LIDEETTKALTIRGKDARRAFFGDLGGVVGGVSSNASVYRFRARAGGRFTERGIPRLPPKGGLKRGWHSRTIGRERKRLSPLVESFRKGGGGGGVAGEGWFKRRC